MREQPVRRQSTPSQSPERRFGVGLARAFGGALLFSLPMLMTMEMWWLGFLMKPSRLALLMLLMLPILVGLSHFSGFESTFGWQNDLVDAFAAYAVGFIAAAFILPLLGIFSAGMSVQEVVGKVAIQAIAGSLGALLARSQIINSRREESEKEETQRRTGYFGELFIMAVGALFLAFNIAPTEEIILIAYKLSPGLALLLMLFSLALMHAFIYALQMRENELPRHKVPQWSIFLRFTVVAYAISMLMSGYMLWTFDRFAGTALLQVMMMIVVLSFPAALGAAAARLVL